MWQINKTKAEPGLLPFSINGHAAVTLDKVATKVWLRFPLLRLEGIDLSLNSHAFSVAIGGSAESNVGRGHKPFL